MKPVHYTLHLEPDLEQFTFQGRTEIEILSKDPTEQIVLNAADLALTSCQVQKEGQELTCAFSLNPEREEVTIALPEPMGGDSNGIHLTVEYTGTLNDQLRGFYRSKYEHDGQERYIAVTQFEERDARRAFPCIDDPGKKATFDVEFLIDNDLTGIANTAVKEEILQGEKKLVRFERTPRMSTYLLFFGVGEFEFIQDDSAKPVIRVAATPGKVQYGDFALQMGRKALTFGEEYTGIAYPISKCDHIAVPDFVFGAMENYGAITYRENLLLLYPGITSREGIKNMASVIAHETIHMWFGDLVSPAEWKYIWLNESFASYFTTVITDHYYPEWELQDAFLVEGRVNALERDALLETVPVELPGDEAIHIDPSSAPIIYRKGASIIRMLVDYLGEERVRAGINHFLEMYKFDCATSQQYWEAFEQATGEPVGAFADSWVYQPGYPIVQVRRVGNELHLAQRRFTFSPHTSSQTWVIPVNILVYLRDGETQTIHTLMREETATVPIPEETVAFQVNHGQAGFYRVQYEKPDLDQLGRLIKEGKLSAADSFGVENDLFALVRSGAFALADYVTFIGDCFSQEDRFLPLLDISENLMTLYLVVESRRDEIAGVGRPIFEQALEEIGLEPQPDESLQVSSLRSELLWSAFTFGSGMAAEFGAAQFQALLDGKAVHEDIRSSVLRIGAVAGAGAFDYFAKKLRAADTPEPEKVSVLDAVGYLRDREKLLAALELNLNEVPKKNQVYIVTGAARNPAAIPFMWQWFVDHLEDLAQFLPGQFARTIVGLAPVCGQGKEPEVKQVLTGLEKKHPRAQGTITMTLEILDIYSRLRTAK